MFDRDRGPRLCFDIGGANLKSYHTVKGASCVGFPMWIHPQSLAAKIQSMASNMPACPTWGITMTGEMADVFASRAEGVRAIVEQVAIAASRLSIPNVRYYGTAGRFMNAEQAMGSPELVASANWHALANWVSSWIERPSLLVDVGSTTADLIPVSPGRVDTPSRTDHDRLRRGELVYLGIGRTPVCAIVDALPFLGNFIPVMRERFACTDDCALLLGWIPEDANDLTTCDSRPRTIAASVNRIARMIGLDNGQVSIAQATGMAEHVMGSATALIARAGEQHQRHAHAQWVLSGHATRLIRRPPAISVIDLAEKLGSQESRVGPAFALCKLIEHEQTEASAQR